MVVAPMIGGLFIKKMQNRRQAKKTAVQPED